MEFRIADTFTDSLARLTGEEQKAVKTTAFDLQMDPTSPGLSFHKLDKARDRNFWSVRVNRDVRLIVHKTRSSLLLCYVDHHDKAYAWAERRRLETHPKTGAAQMVEIVEVQQEIRVPIPAERQRTEQPAIQKGLFDGLTDDELLSYGIPAAWLGPVRRSNEDSILLIADHLPAEAQEAVLEIATGGKPPIRLSASLSAHTSVSGTLLVTEDADAVTAVGTVIEAPAFEHPDAQRRFTTIETPEELQRALEYPWDKWTVFLHPDQRTLIEREQTGAARVAGSAGTGKTIVALHRAVYLARTYREGRVLLATYSEPLAHALSTRLRRLISNEPRLGERIDVASVPAVGARLYRSLVGPLKLADRDAVVTAVKSAAATVGEVRFSSAFLLSEWDQVVDAWQLASWEEYRGIVRLGRKTKLPDDRRKTLWGMFERVRTELGRLGLVTEAAMFARLTTAVKAAKNLPYTFAVIDEAQDVSVSQLKFFAALGGDRPNGLFFAGDLGQRIFQHPFSWKALGVDVRGRAKTLRVNYRTSHQIRAQADRLLEAQVADVDGIEESRGDAVSVFNGVPPTIATFGDEAAEVAAVRAWVSARIQDGLAAHEIGLFVRSAAQLPRARMAVEGAGVVYKLLDERVEGTSGFASVGTMHLAKGLEFRAVAVMACDDEVIPLQSRIETVGEDSDLKEVYDTERQLLYVACTRARDFLMVSGVEPASEFLDDLRAP